MNIFPCSGGALRSLEKKKKNDNKPQAGEGDDKLTPTSTERVLAPSDLLAHWLMFTGLLPLPLVTVNSAGEWFLFGKEPHQIPNYRPGPSTSSLHGKAVPTRASWEPLRGAGVPAMLYTATGCPPHCPDVGLLFTFIQLLLQGRVACACVQRSENNLQELALPSGKELTSTPNSPWSDPPLWGNNSHFIARYTILLWVPLLAIASQNPSPGDTGREPRTAKPLIPFLLFSET